MKVCVIGGCGYIGAQLVPWLLADGHTVTVVDTQWFGAGHPADNGKLKVVREDMRDAYLDGNDAIIHLASLSNNDMYAVSPNAVRANNRWLPLFHANILIYASSVAAYGTSDDILTEDAPLRPTTPYGEDKARCEETVLKTGGTVVRAASVCGASMNMRFDLTVNRLVRDAVMLGKMTVNGGAQKRCHIHMQDICDFYRRLLNAPSDKIAGQAFNVVGESSSVLETAMLVERTIETNPVIDIGHATDNRSYTVSGDKAREVLWFTPRKIVENAIFDLEARFHSGYWKDALTNKSYLRMRDALP